MADRKFGRISPLVLPHLDDSIMHFGAVAPIRLKSAPPKWSWWKPGIPRIMGNNNKWGTCGPTSYANALKVFSSYTQTNTVVLTSQEILGIYEILDPTFNPNTGQNDNGVILTELYELEKTNGARGVNLTDHFAIDPAQNNSIKWTIRIFGPVCFGVSLTQADIQATEAKQPWRLPARRLPSIGGHAVAVYGWDDSTGLWDAESWAEDQPITYEWAARNTEEVRGLIHPYQFSQPGGTAFTGLNERDMRTDAGLIKVA